MRTAIYSVLIVLTVLGTMISIGIGFHAASEVKSQWGNGDALFLMSLLPLIPMLVTCKVYNDLKKLIISQDAIISHLKIKSSNKVSQTNQEIDNATNN